MRICLFSTTFFPKIGGAEFVIHYIAYYLTELGHKVTVLVPQYRGYKEQTKYIYDIHRYYLLPHLLFLEPTLITYLMIEKIKTEFDILHCHFAYPSGYCGVKLKKIFNIPVVITVHGVDIQNKPDINYGIRLNPQIDKKVRYAIKKADAITSVSKTIKEEIIKLGGSEEQIYDIPNGVEIKKYKNRSGFGSIREKYKISYNTKIILLVGRNHPVKGYDYCLKAISRVKNIYSGIKCIIIGSNVNNLKSSIHQLGLDNIVILLEPMSNDTLVDFYLAADMFVSTSLMESFGIVILEAMAAGLPIIVTDIAGSRDIVKNGVNGLIIPPSNPEVLAEKIIELLENDKLRDSISQNAKIESQKYEWEVIARKYVNVYQNVSKNWRIYPTLIKK